MKHLISVPVLVLSLAACSSDPSNGGSGGTTGASGSTNTAAGTGSSAGSPTGAGGSAGSSTGSVGGSGSLAGSSNSTAGAAPTAGSSSGGSSSGGSSSGGSASGGAPSTGGSGPAAAFKCDNLSLKPSMTGVAKPAGAAGGLKVLDWAGFKGAASYTFDDNTPSQLDNYAAMKATGGHFTWFVIAGNVTSQVSGYKATLADGQEIANHTQNHNDVTQKNVTDGQNTIKSSFGVNANSLAAPNCDAGYAAFAPSVMFQNRGPCGKGIASISPRDNTDPFKLPAWLPDGPESAADMSGAITEGKWRIFVIHGFDSRNGTYHPVSTASTNDSMSKAVKDGYWVEGISNVGAYWQGQKLIPASATTTAMWTLPAKFPPNMCLRITTSGGTVTQKGNTVNWDDHGYYEISLDAGEVTVK